MAILHTFSPKHSGDMHHRYLRTRNLDPERCRPRAAARLLTSSTAPMPPETPGECGLRTAEEPRVCALLEEGTLNVKRIDPAHGAGFGTVSRIASDGARSARAGELSSRFQ